MVTKTSSGAVSYLRSIYLLCKAHNHYPFLFKQTTLLPILNFSVFSVFIKSDTFSVLLYLTPLFALLQHFWRRPGYQLDHSENNAEVIFLNFLWIVSKASGRMTSLSRVYCKSVLEMFLLFLTGGRRRCMLPFPGSCPTRSSCLDQRVENCKKSWREIHKIIFC